jgi:hypothetical protein
LLIGLPSQGSFGGPADFMPPQALHHDIRTELAQRCLEVTNRKVSPAKLYDIRAFGRGTFITDGAQILKIHQFLDDGFVARVH